MPDLESERRHRWVRAGQKPPETPEEAVEQNENVRRALGIPEAPPREEHPESDRMRAVSEESQAIGEFLDTSGYVLATYIDCETAHEGGWCDQEPHLAPVQRSIEQVLADYFKIDLNLVEQERRAMLRDLTERQEQERSETARVQREWDEKGVPDA